MQIFPSKDPLHGKTLEMQVTELVAHFGWAELAGRVNINCFKSDPSVKSSLKFLRRTPWARKQVDALYLDLLRERELSKKDPADASPWNQKLAN